VLTGIIGALRPWTVSMISALSIQPAARGTGRPPSARPRRSCRPGSHGGLLGLSADGIDVSQRKRCRRHRRDADASFPTGVAVSAQRREALIEWAERGDRLMIDDDYDAELCRECVVALQGLAPTASSTSARPASG
jgi:hypothetical protein